MLRIIICFTYKSLLTMNKNINTTQIAMHNNIGVSYSLLGNFQGITWDELALRIMVNNKPLCLLKTLAVFQQK